MVRRRNRRPRASAPPQQGCLGLSLGVFEVQNQSESTSSADDFPPADTLNYLEGEDHCAMCNSRPARRCLWCQSNPLFSSPAVSKAVQAIFFPETDYRPQLTWVEYESGVDNFNGTNWTKLLTDPYLGYNSPKKGRVRIEENQMRSQAFGKGFERRSSTREGYCITMMYRASGNHRPNESITTSLSVAGAGESPIRGPVVAVRERPGKIYEDIALSDFRNIVDYFLNHLASLQVSHIFTAPTTGPAAPAYGVKIRCCGETRHNAGVGFQSVDIDTAGCALGDNGVISPISKLLGMPPRLRKCANQGSFRDESNPNASMLMLILNPERYDWGIPHLRWSPDIGNVMVVRDDGENLDVRDLQMMCHFARFKLRPIFERIVQERSEVNSGDEDDDQDVPIVGAKQKALDWITWENMVKHWEAPGWKGFGIEAD